ncbi:MAG: chemotaxis protein CheA [Chthoniobacteraceae bacterium]|nr:chemotaxis protein CheA [Chthoniobacteraceae bacterium]
MDDILREFIIETHENLDLLDRELVSLESAPSPETLAAIFRAVHTIKGGSGFLAMPKLEAVTHAAESLLSDLRDGKLTVIPQLTTSLLQTVDAVRRILGSMETAGTEGDADDADLIAALSRLREGTAVPEAPAPAEAPEAAEAPDARTQNVSETSVRVDVSLLDRLMNLAGELVLARNQILQAPCADPSFLAAAQRLNLITTELQAGVMKARMQPISNVWGKFPRIVRDLAQTCHKQVRLEMSGEETELDRTIIEAIKDPLTHLLRNAVDHGIGAPAERAKSGKPPEGRLSLRAFHENGQVNIEIADDGAGVDIKRVKAKAIERGMLTAEAAAHLSSRDAISLIFAPGFSTAETVSNISGRGVGMDVVKTNIERIGGSVECESQPGAGTTFKIKIPLTLAIIPALIVRCGGDRYAIPQVSVTELVRLDEAKSIEHIQGAPVHRLRGELLPLVYLGSELQVQAGDAGAVDVVVLQTGERRFGLVVDEVCDTEEIVVKALGSHLKGTACFAGATIMGDGAVALILDVFGLAQRGGLIGAGHASLPAANPAQHHEADGGRQTLLLFDLSESQRMAIALSTVARLEEFQSKDIEWAGGREVIQYRGKILPLIRASSFFSSADESAAPHDGTLQAVVYNENGRNVGLVVGRIRDITSEHVVMQTSARHTWTLGSAVIQDRVTDLLDVPAIIRASEKTLSPEAPR